MSVGFVDAKLIVDKHGCLRRPPFITLSILSATVLARERVGCIHTCLPGTWCLGVWSWASIQYTVYRIQYLRYRIQYLRYLDKGGGGPARARPGRPGLDRALLHDFFEDHFLISTWTSHFSVFGVNLASC